MRETIPVRLLLEPGRAFLEKGAPGGRPLTFAEVQEFLARPVSGAPNSPATAAAAPLGSPLGGLRATDWIENGWGPSLYYFVQARLALMSRRHGTNVYAAPLVDVTVKQLLGRRTHRTFAHRLRGASKQGAVGEICELLMRCDFAEEVSVVVLTYADESEAAMVRTIANGRDEARPLAATTTHIRQRIHRAMAGMQAPLTATVSVFFLLDLSAYTEARRDDFSLIERLTEMGELAQVIVMLGESLGLGALVTPGFSDAEIADALKLECSQIPMYSVTLGPKRASRPTGSIG